jgi:hypothetical protein
MNTLKRTIATTLVGVTTATMLAACTYHEPRTVPAASYPIAVPAASPTTVVVPPAQTPTRVNYPDGAYELRGYGTPNSPYYWVWVPHGIQSPMLPPPPPLPPAR